METFISGKYNQQRFDRGQENELCVRCDQDLGICSGDMCSGYRKCNAAFDCQGPNLSGLNGTFVGKCMKPSKIGMLA